MAKLGVRVEATEEGTSQQANYDNLPNGVYRLQMEACEVVEKNEGTPEHSIMVKSTFEVVEPDEYEKRKIFGNYNLQNKSDVAQKIGNEQFQCLLRSMGMTEVLDDETDNLLFTSFIATVGMGKDSKEKNADGTPVYAAKNEIKRYWFPDLNDAPPIGVTAGAKPVAANNNQRPAANQNTQGSGKPFAVGGRPASAPASGGRTWGKK